MAPRPTTRSIGPPQPRAAGSRVARGFANPARRTANGLNAALAAGGGDVIVRVDARSRIGVVTWPTPCGCSASAPTWASSVAGNAPVRGSASLRDRWIARALRNRFTTGLAGIDAPTAPGPADTVWMGAFRTDDLRALGGWDEAVARNEDYDLNRRFRETGTLVWFDPEMDAETSRGPDLRRLCCSTSDSVGSRARGGRGACCPAPRQIALVLAPVAAAGGAVVCEPRSACSRPPCWRWSHCARSRCWAATAPPHPPSGQSPADGRVRVRVRPGGPVSSPGSRARRWACAMPTADMPTAERPAVSVVVPTHTRAVMLWAPACSTCSCRSIVRPVGSR